MGRLEMVWRTYVCRFGVKNILNVVRIRVAHEPVIGSLTRDPHHCCQCLTWYGLVSSRSLLSRLAVLSWEGSRCVYDRGTARRHPPRCHCGSSERRRVGWQPLGFLLGLGRLPTPPFPCFAIGFLALLIRLVFDLAYFALYWTGISLWVIIPFFVLLFLADFVPFLWYYPTSYLDIAFVINEAI